MSLRTGRLAIAAPVAEILALVGLLAPSVAVFAAMNATATARMIEMQQLALWTAPIAGFLACVLGGWWVARKATAAHERNGLVLGVAVAALDLALLLASGAPLGALMVLSIAGRVVGGYVGGRLAAPRSRSARIATSTPGEALQ